MKIVFIFISKSSHELMKMKIKFKLKQFTVHYQSYGHQEDELMMLLLPHYSLHSLIALTEHAV